MSNKTIHRIGDRRTIVRTLQPGLHPAGDRLIELRTRHKAKITQELQYRYPMLKEGLEWTDLSIAMDSLTDCEPDPEPGSPPRRSWMRRVVDWFWGDPPVPPARVVSE